MLGVVASVASRHIDHKSSNRRQRVLPRRVLRRECGKMGNRLHDLLWAYFSALDDPDLEPERSLMLQYASMREELIALVNKISLHGVEVGVICPDETALLIPRGGGILAVADGLVRMGDGPLGFVPDAYMGDDPERVKAGLKQAYGRLLNREFDHLLLAHGFPWIGGAKQALREFVSA